MHEDCTKKKIYVNVSCCLERLQVQIINMMKCWFLKYSPKKGLICVL